MTVGRIKEIKGIGTFTNFLNGASLGFEKLTFIYGFNTYGKTTLTDIFQSLKDNNVHIIKSRKTIPRENTQQKVVFTEKNTTESDVKFENDTWGTNGINKNLEIFGTDFIHKNLFTGLIIERENRENFTQFVLGEQGVKLAKEIAGKRKILGDSKRNLKLEIPYFVKDKTDEEIKNFIDFSVDVSRKDEIEAQLIDKQRDLHRQKELIKEPTKILNLQEPEVFNEPVINIIELLRKINFLLQKNYLDIKDELLTKLEQHINTNFANIDNAEDWIKEGMKFCKNAEDHNCPFCGQSLKGAKDLIDMYNSYFDRAYNVFIKEVEDGLSSNLATIEKIGFRYKTQLQDSLTRINQFKDLITDTNFTNKISELENKIYSLQENELHLSKEVLLKDVKLKCDLKNKTPHKKIDSINIEDFEYLVNQYFQLLKEVKQIIDDIKIEIARFKESHKNIQEIQKKTDEIIKEISDLEYQKARIVLDVECQRYKESQEEVMQIEEDIVLLQEKLKTDQSTYLDSYFTKMNKLFKKLGSKNFTLGRGIDNAGHMPVYFLKVKFHGVEISNDQLKAVFSESDRRALSLAIFWAKICLKTDDEKRKSVIILDDPVTSFDDNRVTNSIALFKEKLENINQMIILTHYPNLIKRFCEMTKEVQITTKYLKIEQNDTTSLLVECRREEFTQSDYDRIFLKIYGFINKIHSNCIKTDLRPFFENLYLPTIFAKQIKDKQVDCNDLKSMINGIFEEQAVKTKLHEFRTTLNPDSHFFTLNNDEDVRNFANEMMNYLYSIKIVGGN